MAHTFVTGGQLPPVQLRWVAGSCGVRTGSVHKDWFGDYTSTLSGLKDFVTGHLRRALVVLWSAVGMIMLIACVNLSNLLLACSAARSKEFALAPLQQTVDRSVSSRRFFVVLVASFAGLGLLLASLGIYGVISYGVAHQKQEIGIRLALGASAQQVQFGVIARSLRLVATGIALGTVGSLVVAHSIGGLLFQTDPTDTTTFACIVLMLGAVSFLAGYIPARRASRIDPMIAMRTT
jgi:ABC-type antimicrobial peptide transport system permease subunit